MSPAPIEFPLITRVQQAGNLATLGHGGTGLTFSDEDVSAAFGALAACMLAVSIGTPVHRAKAGGTPGRPTRLAG
ncbi:hypothetical protein [Micromonospora sp. NPDC049679]|uniref:hypothetical protein n=1 Tax=Micromonospora sp. NPDC049679 TaxID=3155920 RepID=UPI0033E101C3